jgi:hypothetical protein
MFGYYMDKQEIPHDNRCHTGHAPYDSVWN